MTQKDPSFDDYYTLGPKLTQTELYSWVTSKLTKETTSSDTIVEVNGMEKYILGIERRNEDVFVVGYDTKVLMEKSLATTTCEYIDIAKIGRFYYLLI